MSFVANKVIEFVLFISVIIILSAVPTIAVALVDQHDNQAAPTSETATKRRFLDQEKHLPWPVELNADVQFWIDVYTKVDTNSGYIHDPKHLHIVYGKIKLDKNSTPKKRRKLVKQHKKTHRAYP